MIVPSAASARRPTRRARRGLLPLGTALCFAATAAAQAPPDGILLVPLDDRPTSRHVPRALGAVAGVVVRTPPSEMLGRFTRPADATAVAAWLRREGAARPTHPVVVSLDLLAYGGLVASRRAASATVAAATGRVETLRAVRAAAPARPITVVAALMRLAPTADGTDEPSREPLARWAELAADTAAAATTERRALEARLPADVLARYRAARARNLAVVTHALGLVADGTIDHLVLAQDDARPRGVHLAERDTLQARIAALGIASRVTLQPGTDEVAMLLVARAIAVATGRAPTVAVAYADPADAERVMPFEDRPLDATVSAALATAGARRLAPGAGAATADLQLIVHAARRRAEGTGAAARLVESAARPVILADIDPTGAIQGADTLLTDRLVAGGRFATLAGYGAWNTAGNAVGTAVAFGVLRWLGMTAEASRGGGAGAATAREAAYRTMLLERLLDDDLYHARIRPGLVAALRARGEDPFRLTPTAARATEETLTAALTARLPWALAAVAPAGTRCRLARPVRATLPWDRPFEAAFTLTLSCD